MDPVIGRLDGVGFTPGRTDGQLWLTIKDHEGAVILNAAAPDADMTYNGLKVNLTEVMVILATPSDMDIYITVHPRGDRYGAATKAEFTQSFAAKGAVCRDPSCGHDQSQHNDGKCALCNCQSFRR